MTGEREQYPDPLQDRRDGVRLRTVFQAARLLIDGDCQHLCLIRNIGPGGMMLETFTSIPVDTRVLVEPKMFDPVEGVVRWSSGSRVGVEFDVPVNLDEYLCSRQSILPHQQPRGPRVLMQMRCRLRIGAIWHLVALLDISQGGAKIVTDLPVTLGEEVELDLEGIAPMRAHIRWIRGERVGMTFVQPIQLAMIGQWVARLSNRSA